MKAFNYRTEPFENRLKPVPDLHQAFSSLIYGDPATLLFEAKAAVSVTAHVLMPASKPWAHSFTLHAHNFKQQPEDLDSQVRAAISAVTVGKGEFCEAAWSSKSPQNPLVTSCTVRETCSRILNLGNYPRCSPREKPVPSSSPSGVIFLFSTPKMERGETV